MQGEYNVFYGNYSDVLYAFVQCRDVIERSLSGAQELISDVDLHLRMHDHYGKGFIKRCKISPDAYVQMALQLAYYRVIVSCLILCLCCPFCV